MPTRHRRPAHVTATLAAILLFPTAFLLIQSPAKAADSLLDTMLDAARNAPRKLYEGDAKTYPAGIMTPETLKSCLILAHRLDSVGTGIQGEKEKIRELDELIRDAGPRLQNQAVAALTDPERRKVYEAQVSDYNAWVDQRRKTVERHNREVRHFSELSGRFNGECNGRSYYPTDLAAIQTDLPPEIAERVK
ncbi:MAG: hypothetical protein RIA64_11145 [Rhodospirillales bacterium]